MEAGGNGRESPRNGHDRDAAGETVEFGGLPFRLPFGGLKPLRALEARLGPRGPHRTAVRTVAISLALGLLIGFAAGHFTAHSAGKKPAGTTIPVVIPPEFATTVISATGRRCAIQVGKNLQLGIQVVNGSRRLVTLGRISTAFPLGGLRSISGGIGPCGVLSNLDGPARLPAGSTEWVVATVGVRVRCPQPQPVWFNVGYSIAGTRATTVLEAFPDLGPVHYRHCPTDAVASVVPTRGNDPLEFPADSPTVEIVDQASGRSYGG